MTAPSVSRSVTGLSGTGPNRTNRNLVEAELVASVAWLIRLRWLAGVGVILATWTVDQIIRVQAPTGELYIVGACILIYNLFFYLTERRYTVTSAQASAFTGLAMWQTGLDWVAMALLIHLSGGVESPAIFFFIFHIIIASIFFSKRAAFTFTLLAIGLVSGIAMLEYFSILPHKAIVGYLDNPLYSNELYLLALLFFFAGTGIIAVYLVSSIQDRLRRREQEIVELSESLQRATIRLQALNDSARVVGSTLELKGVLNRLVEASAIAMSVRACSIRLLDKTRQHLEPIAVHGLSQTYLDKGPVDPVTNPLAREVLSGKTVNIPDAPTNQLIQYPEEAKQEGIRSMLSAPLIGKNGPLGILRAYAVEPNRFSKEDEEFLAAIAAQGSIAIENAMAYQSIRELDEVKSQFVRMVTHELRSPVGVTRSLLKTVAGGFAGKITEQQEDILNRAIHRVDFLQRLVDDLLDLAAGKVAIWKPEEIQSIRLDEQVRKVVERYEVSAKEKGLALEWLNGSGKRPFLVMATLDGLDRVFNNLVSNAVKYTPSGGRVTVALERLGEEAQVIVEDTGIGIPEDAIPNLFQEFYRAPNAKELEQEGTGLGLTIVKDLVTRFGGRVSVQSRQNAGTKFTVTLPLVKDSKNLS